MASWPSHSPERAGWDDRRSQHAQADENVNIYHQQQASHPHAASLSFFPPPLDARYPRPTPPLPPSHADHSRLAHKPDDGLGDDYLGSMPIDWLGPDDALPAGPAYMRDFSSYSPWTPAGQMLSPAEAIDPAVSMEAWQGYAPNNQYLYTPAALEPSLHEGLIDNGAIPPYPSREHDYPLVTSMGSGTGQPSARSTGAYMQRSLDPLAIQAGGGNVLGYESLQPPYAANPSAAPRGPPPPVPPRPFAPSLASGAAQRVRPSPSSALWVAQGPAMALSVAPATPLASASAAVISPSLYHPQSPSAFFPPRRGPAMGPPPIPPRPFAPSPVIDPSLYSPPLASTSRSAMHPSPSVPLAQSGAGGVLPQDPRFGFHPLLGFDRVPDHVVEQHHTASSIGQMARYLVPPPVQASGSDTPADVFQDAAGRPGATNRNALADLIASGGQSKRGHERKQLLKEARSNPDAMRLLNEELDRICSVVCDMSLPSVQSKRRSMVLAWQEFLEVLHGEVPEAEHWERTPVGLWSEHFLTMKVMRTKGQNGHERISAPTLLQWCDVFIWCIQRFCFHGDNLRAGMDLLLRDGLYFRLENRCSQLIKEFNLRRHRSEQIFFGRPEYRLLAQIGLERTALYNRANFLQVLAAANLSFNTGARAGTLAWSFAQYKAEGNYLKNGDIKIYVLARATWRVVPGYRSFKGGNGNIGIYREFELNPVEKAHNVGMDPGPTMIAQLLAKGDLPFNTVDEILDWDEPVLPILNPDKPFLLKGEAAGAGFSEDEPLSARQLTANLQHYLKLGWLPGATHSWRRGLGSDIVLMAGEKAAGTVLVHSEAQTTAGLHYSRTTKNWDTVAMRTGESSLAQKPEYIAARARQLYTSPAMMATIRRTYGMPDPAQVVTQKVSAEVEQPIDLPVAKKRKLNELTEEELESAMGDERLAPLKEAVDEHWKKLCELVPTLDHSKIDNTRAFMKEVKSAIAKRPTKVKEVTLQPIMDSCLSAWDAYLKATRLAKSKVTKAKDRKALKMNAEEPDVRHTVAQRNDLVAELDSVNTALIEANKLYGPNAQTRKDKGKGREVLSDGDEESLAVELPQVVPGEGRQDHAGPSVRAAVAGSKKRKREEEDEEEHQADQDDEDLFNDADEADILDCTAAEMRESFLRFLVEPVFEQREKAARQAAEQCLCTVCKTLRFDPAAGTKDWKTPSLLRQHLGKGHRDPFDGYVGTDSPQRWVCPFCLQDFTASNHARRHMKKFHKQEYELINQKSNNIADVIIERRAGSANPNDERWEDVLGQVLAFEDASRDAERCLAAYDAQ